METSKNYFSVFYYMKIYSFCQKNRSNFACIIFKCSYIIHNENLEVVDVDCFGVMFLFSFVVAGENRFSNREKMNTEYIVRYLCFFWNNRAVVGEPLWCRERTSWYFCSDKVSSAYVGLSDYRKNFS